MVKSVGMKVGDTLIEVMFAVAIFSLVAISAVAVMNSGVTNTQSALEATMARTEIDAQAEALRFIQSSYNAERTEDDNNSYYAQLWKAIIALANDATADVTQYAPMNCAELYDNDSAKGILRQHGFVINTRKLGSTDDANDALIKDRSRFYEPAIYPRIIYDDDVLLSDITESDAQRVEGIYVTAVKDPGSTTVRPGGTDKDGSVYYDFYIRTCWYAPGKDIPTTLSTVIRLYDPDMQVVEQ